MEEDIIDINKTIKICESLIKDTKESIDKNFEKLSERRITNRMIACKALENLLTRYKQLDSLIGEIDNKEASDALHMLLHCALTNKDFETQKQQFQIVNAYIKQLEEENAKYKYKCEIMFNKLIEYSKTTEKLQKETIWKSKVKEKIEEIEQEDLEIYDTDSEDLVVAKYEYRAVLDALQDLLREE